jgi:hypothetical protein
MNAARFGQIHRENLRGMTLPAALPAASAATGANGVATVPQHALFEPCFFAG